MPLSRVKSNLSPRQGQTADRGALAGSRAPLGVRSEFHTTDNTKCGRRGRHTWLWSAERGVATVLAFRSARM
jgi:hypothetical protein